MDKSRVEIIKLEEQNKKLKLKKQERRIDKRGILLEVLVIFSFIGIFWYYPLASSKNSDITNAIITSVIGIAIIVISVILTSIKSVLEFSIDDEEATTYYLIAGIKINKKKYSLQNVEQYTLVRFNPFSLLFEGNTIRRALSITNKYAIYINYNSNEYERLVGFNNYYEIKLLADKIRDLAKIKMVDSSNEEYKDEDQFISAYFQYKKVVNEVKDE